VIGWRTRLLYELSLNVQVMGWFLANHSAVSPAPLESGARTALLDEYENDVPVGLWG